MTSRVFVPGLASALRFKVGQTHTVELVGVGLILEEKV